MPDPTDMMAAMASSLRDRTGHTLEEWLVLVQRSEIDPLDQLAVRNWLRDVHGVKQNSQWVIADAAAKAAGWERPSVAEYVDSQYTGKFAAVQALASRVDLGLRFTAAPSSERLAAGSAPGQSTHKITLKSVEDVDTEVEALLRAAYEQNA